MAKSRPPLEAAADAALTLAAERAWSEITLRDLAEAAGLKMTDFYGVVRSKDDVVDALTARFDRAAADGVDIEIEAPMRERVFDAAMARFEAMEAERPALVSIISSATSGPLGLAHAAPRGLKTARWLLELAGVDTSGAPGAAMTAAFAFALARALRAWLEDEGGDLSRTMAALDRGLRDIETWRDRFKTRGRRGGEAGPEEGASEGED